MAKVIKRIEVLGSIGGEPYTKGDLLPVDAFEKERLEELLRRKLVRIVEFAVKKEGDQERLIPKEE